MKIDRTQIVTTAPVTLAVAKAHCRIAHADDDAVIDRLIYSAAADIEAQAGLALMDTTITVTLDAGELESPVHLGIGPVAPGATATVETVGEDGGTSALASGWRLEAGRWPRLHLTDASGVGLAVTYVAGFGDQPDDIPADLQAAIADQVAWLFDRMPDRGPLLAPSAARAIARWRGVRL